MHFGFRRVVVTQGVTRYFELNEKMVNAHRRVVAGMGPDTFKTQVLDRFGLVLDDEAVNSVAVPLGWQSAWLGTRQGKAAPPTPSHDITAMFNHLPTEPRAMVALPTPPLPGQASVPWMPDGLGHGSLVFLWAGLVLLCLTNWHFDRLACSLK